MKCKLTHFINVNGKEVESQLFNKIFDYYNTELDTEESIEKLVKDGYAKFQTQEFKDKFAGSIAIDDNGEPLLLYLERTENDLHYFNTKAESQWFNPTPVVLDVKKALNEPYDINWNSEVLKGKINEALADGFISKSNNIYVVPTSTQIIPLERQYYDFTREEHNHIMNILSNMLRQDRKNLEKSKKITDKKEDKISITVKERLINALGYAREVSQEVINDDQYKFIDRIIYDLDDVNSKLWKDLKDFTSRERGIEVIEFDDLNIEDSRLTKDWDESLQYKKSVKENVNNNIKDFVDSFLQKSNEFTIDKDGKRIYKLTANTFTGFTETIDFNTIYPYLFSNMIGAINEEDMLNRLKKLGDNVNPVFTDIANELTNDKVLLKAWYSTFDKHIPPSVANLLTIDNEGNTRIETVLANKAAFSEYYVSNDWLNTINKLIESKYFGEAFNKKYEDLRNKILSEINYKNLNTLNIDKLADLTSDIFDLFNMSISKSSVLYNLDQRKNLEKVSIPTNITNAQDIQNYKYIEIWKNSYSNPLKYLKEYVDNKIVSKDTEFNHYRDLKELANISKIFYIDKVEHTSLNVNNDKIYDIQLPSFISDFFKYIKSGDTNTINERLEDLKKIPYLKYSNWLWTTDKRDGLFYQDGTLNKKFIENFNYFQYSGIKNLTDNIGISYANLNTNDYVFTELIGYLTSMTRNSSNKRGVNIFGQTPSDSITQYGFTVQKVDFSDTDFSNIHSLDKLKSSEMFIALKNTVMQEITRMEQARDLLFNIKKDGSLEVKRSLPNLQQYYHFKEYDDENNPILLEDGIPTGRVFQFHNMYTIENGKRKTLNDSDFYNNGLFYFNSNINNEIDNFVQSFIIGQVNYAKSLKKYESTLKKGGKNNSNLYSHISNNFDVVATDFVLNKYIHNIESQNLWYGTPADFKNYNDQFKRAKQISANGVSQASKEVYYGVTLADIFLKSKNYNERINTTDAQSFITLDLYKKKLINAGKLTIQLEDIFSKLEKNEKLDESKITEFLNPLKGFYYSNRYDEKLNKLVPNQIKNSEQVLIPQYIEGRQMKVLYDFMVKNNIHQVNFESAEKVGNKGIVDIHDNDGSLIYDEDTLQLPKEIQSKLVKYKREYYFEDWKLQQEVVEHTEEAENNLGKQISKDIFKNINFDAKYNVNGVEKTGRELFDDYHKYLSSIIQGASLSILEKLGAKFHVISENGKDIDKRPIIDEDGNIPISNVKVQKFLKKEIINRGLGSNFDEAIEFIDKVNGKNVFKMPLYYNAMAKKWESVLLAKFTNNVTNIKFPGVHAVLRSTAFMGDLKPGSEDSIMWTDELKARPNKDLKTMELSQDGKSVLVAEVVLGAWSKDFYKEGELIDINKIPEEIRTQIGYRIPTEGKHSMYVFKVVGFLPRVYGSTVILPNDFVIQSGTDFDIDSLYTLLYNFYIDKDGNYKISKLDPNKTLYTNRKEAKQNAILDIYKAILTNPIHLPEINSASGFEDIKEASRIINKALSIKLDITNNTLEDSLIRRQMALDGRVLKGLAVNRNSLLSILQPLKGRLREGIKVRYPIDQLDFLKSLYGEEAIVENGEVVIEHKTIAHTPTGSFLNVNGQLTTRVASETVANILDNVKDPLPRNIDTYTYQIWQTFFDLGIDPVTGSLFTAQPIIYDLNQHFKSLIGILGEGKGREIENTKRKWQSELYKLLYPNWKSKKDQSRTSKALRAGKHIYLRSTSTNTILGYNLEVPSINKEELINNLENHKNYPKLDNEGKINYLRKQLRILEAFKQYKQIAQQFEDASKVLNTDKLGASPNFEKTTFLNKRIEEGIEIYDENDEPILKSVYPNQLSSTGEYLYPSKVGTESKYGILDAFKKYSNDYSYQSFNNYFLRNIGVFKKLIDKITTDINQPYNQNLINQISNYAGASLLRNFPLFQDINHKQLLGINGYNINLDIKDIRNLEEFKKLSLASKLDTFTRNYPEYKDEGKQHFLNYLDIKLYDEENPKSKYDIIKLLDSDNLDFLVDSMNEMWNSGNLYQRDIIQDIIKYTYVTTGLSFGYSSLSKILPVEILQDELKLGDYLRQIEAKIRSTKEIKEHSDFIRNFKRANWRNEDIVPRIVNRYEYNEELDKKVPNPNYIHYKLQKGIIPINELLFEKESAKIKNATILNLYGNLYEKRQNEQGMYLLPVGKLEKYEFGDKSFLDSNNVGDFVTPVKVTKIQPNMEFDKIRFNIPGDKINENYNKC